MHFNQRVSLFLSLVLCLCLVMSCRLRERQVLPDPHIMYLDYLVSASDKTELVTIRLQFRPGGPEGDAIRIDTPGQVSIDGQLIKAAKAKLNGVYYELQLPADEFSGKHLIIYTSKEGQSFKQEFIFEPFAAAPQLSDSIQRDQDLSIRFAGLDSVDYLDLLLTDTSFRSPGLVRTDTLNNGLLFIHKNDLKALASGPLHLDLNKERQQPIGDGRRFRGQLRSVYNWSREFELY